MKERRFHSWNLRQIESNQFDSAWLGDKIMKNKELLLNQLRDKGFRITKQRKIILDIILNNKCSCCKEIYYQANEKDPSIGIATVYRMVKTLEEIGVIDRRNLYRISYDSSNKKQDGFAITLNNKKILSLSATAWKEALEIGLRTKGFIKEEEIETIIMK